jgi:hypothetical protein
VAAPPHDVGPDLSVRPREIARRDLREDFPERRSWRLPARRELGSSEERRARAIEVSRAEQREPELQVRVRVLPVGCDFAGPLTDLPVDHPSLRCSCFRLARIFRSIKSGGEPPC